MVKALFYTFGIALWGLMIVGLASIGEPQTSWLICDIMGFESVCR